MARASLEELRLDYEDFLRQRELEMLEPEHPALVRFKKMRCKTLAEVRDWVRVEHQRSRDEHRQTRTLMDNGTDKDCSSVPVGESPCSSNVLSSFCLAANAALSLLNLACYLLDRQVERLAIDFESEGGFTERL